MKIGEKEKTFVALSYELTVNGELVEKVTAESAIRIWCRIPVAQIRGAPQRIKQGR